MSDKILTQKKVIDLLAETVVIPEGYTHIGEFAFDYAQMSRVICPDGLKIIRENAFSFCDELEEINIPGTVTKIGKCAFFKCKKLKVLKLSNNVRNIGYMAFANCENLTIHAPKGSYAIEYAKKNKIPYCEI